MDRSCDTNVVQTLFILLNRPDKIPHIERTYNPVDFIELYRLSKKMAKAKQTDLYITPMIMKEVEACEGKLPGIVDFAKNNFSMRVTTSPRLIQTILDLEEELLREDITLSDSTRGAMSAIEQEIKDGMPSRADAHIASENNVLNGHPLFSLNEAHLICFKHSQKPNSPLRSSAILKKNKLMLDGYPLHKVAKKNLKKNTATTFKVKNINKGKEDIVNSMLREL